MSQLKSFIPQSHRPDIEGSRLDKSHRSQYAINQQIAMLPPLHINALVIGPKQDKVLLSLEQAIEAHESIWLLYYEDMHQQWTYTQTHEDSYFICRINQQVQRVIRAKTLYIRGCQVDEHDPFWYALGEFYQFVDSWPGHVLCSPARQCYNESKLYQLNTSIRQASQKYANTSIGRSFVVKGRDALVKLPENGAYIVKSLSGVRSIVVDDSEFRQWDTSCIEHLPVLIQEKVNGCDIRVHVIATTVYGKRSVHKSNIDYRYDDHFFSLRDYPDLPETIQNFCIEVTQLEDNRLMGIDLLETASGFVALEANPSPGWSAYHPCLGIERDAFMNDLIKELTRD